MITISIGGKPLDLPSGFSISIEDTSPIFNERGSQSIPATVPATRRNTLLMKAPFRPDSASDPNFPETQARIACGVYRRSGVMNVTEASRSGGISFNIGFDSSEAYSKWQSKKLKELSGLPVLSGGIDNLLDGMSRIYTGDSQVPVSDLAVFPLALGYEEIDSAADSGSAASAASDSERKVRYWEILNLCDENRYLEQPGTVKRVIDGTLTDVNIRRGYCVSPFVKVWRVLEFIFADLGLEVTENPFKENAELERLVVLNNVADSCCTGTLRYADLMPDCQVSDFLQALWVRFGLVCGIDFGRGTVGLRLLRDILRTPASRSLTADAADDDTVRYQERRYVTLSASTGIDGAAPATERFEDFAKGCDRSDIALGCNIGNWRNVGTKAEPRWDGDVSDELYEDYDPDRDYPDWEPPSFWDDDRDPWLDDMDTRALRAPATRAAVSAAAASPAGVPRQRLAREFSTGIWYRLDPANGRVKSTSSSWFKWDPASEGLEPMDLTSEDECVPIQTVMSTSTGYSFSGRIPLYMFGARHLHTYIKGSDPDKESDGEETPLAFLFAYPFKGHTIGRVNGEHDSGGAMLLDDGSYPQYSLYFQFQDGLFATFWRDYDEILRHGNREIEVTVRMKTSELNGFDMLRPVLFRGVRCLVDRMEYSLPAGSEVNVTFTLRTIQTQGQYFIDNEQDIPPFRIVGTAFEWKVQSDGYDESLLRDKSFQRMAFDAWTADNEYTPHGTVGDLWYIDPDGVVGSELERLTDPGDYTALPVPTMAGETKEVTLKALASFDIYELHDVSPEGDRSDVEYGLNVVGTISIEIPYVVKFVSVSTG